MTLPSTVTYRYGGRDACTVRPTRPVAPMRSALRAWRRSVLVKNEMLPRGS